MAQNLAILALLIISTFLSPILSFTTIPSGSMEFWCDQTPYPDECKHYFITKTPNSIPMQKSDLRKMAIKVALEQAVEAQRHNKWLEPMSRTYKEKAAWADCLKLYEDTIHKLNRTLDPTFKCTDFDTQTWLSAALTNLDTCRTGFMELGVQVPLVANNVSKLISNTLALANSSIAPETAYVDEFPRWVSAGDKGLLQSGLVTPNAVVAQDGSGNYRTIKAALDAAAKRSGSGRYVIHVKSGTYKENLEVKTENIMLVGDGLRNTIITGSKSVVGGSTTFDSATVVVVGNQFIARGITFRNTAGPQNGQAVALRSSSDFSVFYQCGFEGYQDTLYAHSQRQFYRECYIYGTVDFIFGNAAVVFQNCMIYGRRPMAHQAIVVTAQGRSNPNENTGIVIHNSRVLAAVDLKPVLGSFKAFLGRPWKQYSRTVFIHTYLDTLVDPAGWLEWDNEFALNTLYYGEYNNLGPAASSANRVKWGGYRVIRSATEASKFTVANFLDGQSWLRGTGVPFTSTL